MMILEMYYALPRAKFQVPLFKNVTGVTWPDKSLRNSLILVMHQKRFFYFLRYKMNDISQILFYPIQSYESFSPSLTIFGQIGKNWFFFVRALVKKFPNSTEGSIPLKNDIGHLNKTFWLEISNWNFNQLNI